MAVIALEKLENQLNCSICLDTYTNPKLLQCHHVYCQQCLAKLVIRDQQGRRILTCPNCRQVTPVPASGVAGLQTAFHINQFLEIVEKHKKTAAATACPDKTESASKSITVSCPQHHGIEVVLYCDTCEEASCWKCIKKGEKHHSHEYQELNEAFERYKGQMKASLQPMEKQLVTIEKSLAQFDTRHDELSDQRATIEANIHDTFTRLHQTLDTRKTELISQLHQLTQTKLKSLAAQRDLLEITQAQLSSCLLFMRENLQTGNQGEALLMKSTTLRQVKELTTTFQPDMLEPDTEADMIFSALADLSAECQNYGKVHAAGSPDPSKCCATGKGVDTAAVGEKATALLQVVNSNSEPCKTLTTSISCELISEITGTRASGHVERRGQTHYEMSYQPTIKGRHQLHITVEGQHIGGSPFPVSVRSPVEKLRAPILTIAGVGRPWGVAVNKKGEVVVTEWDLHCVTVFSSSGERLRSFGTRGSGPGHFQIPCGVAVDAEDNILVCDNNNHRIQKFTAQGDFLTELGSHGCGPLQFEHPHDIIVNTSNGRVYVSSNHDVRVLSADLSYVGRIGKEGSGEGEFNIPGGVACDSTGNVYVADYANHRIQVFTAEGKFLRMFGRCGQREGELNGPCGIAIDSSDRVYVSEYGNDRVSVFTSEGQLVTAFGCKGNEPGQFTCPRGVTVDGSGVVYVCDIENRVQLF